MYILESTLPASVAHADPVPSLNPAILFLPTNSYSHHPDIYTASTDCSQSLRRAGDTLLKGEAW